MNHEDAKDTKEEKEEGGRERGRRKRKRKEEEKEEGGRERGRRKGKRKEEEGRGKTNTKSTCNGIISSFASLRLCVSCLLI
jgi:hypothetical protein